MTWECFAYNCVGSIVFVSGKMNSQAYQHVLGKYLLPNAGFLTKENLKFRQGNALVHANNSIEHWFLVNNVKTLKWPASL